MGYKLFDFECGDCDSIWEALVEPDDLTDSCPRCGQDCPTVLSIPKLATFSMMSQDEKTAHLKKRSADHTQKEIIEKTPEKWGDEGIKRARQGKIISAGGLEKKKGKKK